MAGGSVGGSALGGGGVGGAGNGAFVGPGGGCVPPAEIEDGGGLRERQRTREDGTRNVQRVARGGNRPGACGEPWSLRRRLDGGPHAEECRPHRGSSCENSNLANEV